MNTATETQRNETKLKQITRVYPARKFLSSGCGYCATAQDHEHLSITYQGRTHAALCPKCYAPKLKWDNWFLAKEYDEELFAKCGECGYITHDDNILIGEIAEKRKEKQNGKAK